MAARHPMHTAVAEITHHAGAMTADIRIRIIAEDFGRVVTGTPGTAATDSAISRYARGRFAMTDRSGRPLSLKWAGARRDGDVILLAFQASTARELKGTHVFSGLLAERFDDQINIVCASYDGRTATLLFTPGDAPKVLP